MDTNEGLCSVRPRVTPRDHQRLRDTLATVDEQGWDGIAATALLAFVREDLVRPLVSDLGIRGAAFSQAEATGWEAAWESLREPSLRSAVSPWGVVWTAARRAVMGEMLAARYCTSVRKAWRLYAEVGVDAATPVLVGTDRLHEHESGCESSARDGLTGFGAVAGPVLDALVDVGWDLGELAALVELIALTAEPGAGRKASKAGWRPIALEFGIEQWRVRRLMVALVGEPGWPGLIERVERSGRSALDDVGAIAAVQSTVVSWMRPPARAARLAEAKAVRDDGQDAACG